MSTARNSVLAATAAMLLAVAGSPTNAAVGDWIEAPSAKLRLVATDRADGSPAVALELVLEPGWKTYWRTPGEGGLQPQFDFSASHNVAEAEVLYPAPTHYDDGYTVTNIYQGRVILPIAVATVVAEVPVTVDVVLQIGICETICIPATIEASITFSPGEMDMAALAIVDEGLAQLPAAPVAGFEISSIETGETPGTYLAVAIVPEAFGSDLFVEGPDGWHPVPAESSGRDGDRVTFSFGFERPDGGVPEPGTEVILTLVSGGAAVEQTLSLP